jgi:hypothetical protein
MKTKCSCYLSSISQKNRVKHSQLKDRNMRRIHESKSNYYKFCCNLNLGLVIKAKACKGAGQKWSPGVTLHAPEGVGECEGLNSHTPRWVPTLRIGIPMESQIFRGLTRIKSHWIEKIPYTIGKFLELRCLKWAHMIHLGLKT